MMLADVSFLCCCCSLLFFSCSLPSASGKPLLTGSPGRVFAVANKDAILPCHLTSSVDPSRITAVEWSRVDGPSPGTIHVLRDGEELEKETAPEYLSRAAIVKDGSLKLLGVQQRDSGTYRCALVLRGLTVEDEVFVSLVVAEVSEVSMSVRRTSDNQLFVHCESSGWSPEPVISLLDASRTVLAAQTESGSVRGPDGLHAVRALVNVAAAKGNGTLICRVEIPGMRLANENRIYVIDEFDPPEAGLGCYFPLVFAFLLVCVAAAAATVVFVVPVWAIVKLRCLKLWDQPLLEDYGDITRLETTGASEETAKANKLLITGTEASHELAKRDLTEMLKYKDIIVSVGKTLCVPPALIGAIISRQSQAGTSLITGGYGRTDPDCFGLMQINKHYHAVKGNPFSKEHVDQGVTFLIQLIKTMRRSKLDWSKEQQLKGALACYIAGEDKVIPLAYKDVDSVTPCGDFASDVVARAKWFAHNGF